MSALSIVADPLEFSEAMTGMQHFECEGSTHVKRFGIE
jgi:hypothetical protein